MHAKFPVCPVPVFYNPVAKIKKFFQTGYHKQISLVFAFCMQINKQIDYRHNKKTSCPQNYFAAKLPRSEQKASSPCKKIQYCTGNDQWVNFFRQEKTADNSFSFCFADTHEFFSSISVRMDSRREKNEILFSISSQDCRVCILCRRWYRICSPIYVRV